MVPKGVLDLARSPNAEIRGADPEGRLERSGPSRPGDADKDHQTPTTTTTPADAAFHVQIIWLNCRGGGAASRAGEGRPQKNAAADTPFLAQIIWRRCKGDPKKREKEKWQEENPADVQKGVKRAKQDVETDSSA